jgi:hypothetical protein
VVPYERVAPDAGCFDEVAAKTSSMVRAVQGRTDDELHSIVEPSLLIAGDADFVPLRHAVEMYELMPRAQLAVLLDTTHMGVTRRAEQVLALVRPYLDGPGLRRLPPASGGADGFGSAERAWLRASGRRDARGALTGEDGTPPDRCKEAGRGSS